MTERAAWNNEGYRSWRWVRCFAWRPVRTFDAGWIFLRPYWRWQCSWGWGFFDNYPYLSKEVKPTERTAYKLERPKP